MAWKKIRYRNFRNIEDAEFEIDSPCTFFVGENGQGKTNILESIYALSTGKSFRSSGDAVMKKEGTGSFTIHGTDSNSAQYTFSFEEKKTITIDGKKCNDRSQLFRRNPAIVFCHEDIDLIRGTSEQRRQLFDQLFSLLSESYMAEVKRYQKILAARNELLKTANLDTLGVYDLQLADSGLRLKEEKLKYVELIRDRIREYYHAINEIRDVDFTFVQSWNGSTIEEVCDYLRSQRGRDCAAGFTTSGPHRDKFGFLMHGVPFENFASIGQHRSLILVVKLIQLDTIAEKFGEKPILLFDDVLLEIDREKRKKFYSLIRSAQQSFFTFLPDEQLQDYIDHSVRIFEVVGGRIHEKRG